jgi:hypothetical protein
MPTAVAIACRGPPATALRNTNAVSRPGVIVRSDAAAVKAMMEEAMLMCDLPDKGGVTC